MTANYRCIHLRDLFRGLQEQMIAALSSSRRNILHPTAKGDVSELRWLDLFDEYLPKRYQAAKAFVLDSTGGISEQQDIVIYDRQYSPYLLNHDGALHVPVESVYAVFEVKQKLGATELKYASGKVASVRSLKRTTARFKDSRGFHKPVRHFTILGGILALESGMAPQFGRTFQKHFSRLLPIGRPDIGCVLQAGAFNLTSTSQRQCGVELSRPDEALVFFFLRLLSRLQAMGTVSAIDFAAYSKSVTSLQMTIELQRRKP